MVDKKELKYSDIEICNQMIRDQYKLHIHRIFAAILDESQGETSLIARAKPYDIKQLLEHFREALMTEVEYHSGAHATRVAEALKALNEVSDKEFHAQLREFQTELNNATDHPSFDHSILSISLALSLALFAASFALASIAMLGMPLGAGALITALITIPISTLITSPIIYFNIPDRSDAELDVQQKGMNFCKLLPTSAPMDTSKRGGGLSGASLGMFAPNRGTKDPVNESTLMPVLTAT